MRMAPRIIHHPPNVERTVPKEGGNPSFSRMDAFVILALQTDLEGFGVDSQGFHKQGRGTLSIDEPEKLTKRELSVLTKGARIPPERLCQRVIVSNL
ncbi:hypothetical protein D3C72_1862130 [compost metagenome]